MTAPRVGLVAFDSGDRLYALTGDGTQNDEAYSYAADGWQRFQSSVAGFQNNFYFMGGAAIGSTFLLLGGTSGAESGPSTSGLILPIQSGSNPTRPVGLISLSSGVSSMGMATLGGNVYMVGGLGNGGVVANVITYSQTLIAQADPNLQSPISGSAGPALRAARGGLGLVAANGKLYAVDGFVMDATGRNGVRATNLIQVFDPTAGTWTASTDSGGPAAPATKRYGCGVAAVGSKIYVVGGVDDQSQTLRSVDIYDTVANTWTSGAPMPTARSGLALVAHNGVLFALGGADATGHALRTVEVYVP